MVTASCLGGVKQVAEGFIMMAIKIKENLLHGMLIREPGCL
jgi:hypothetical protein